MIKSMQMNSCMKSLVISIFLATFHLCTSGPLGPWSMQAQAVSRESREAESRCDQPIITCTSTCAPAPTDARNFYHFVTPPF